MTIAANTSNWRQYQDPNHPLLHRGVVSVTGTKDVDLGVGHVNFIVMPCVKGAIANLANAPAIAWDHVANQPGVFRITVGKPTAAGDTTVIAATVAVDVSFVALVNASTP